MAWTEIVGTIVNTVLIVILVVVVFGFVFLILYLSKYKYRVRIREIVKGRKVIIDDKARIVKKSNGDHYWKTLSTKYQMPLPPSEAIDISNKGKKLVEVYLTETGDFQYIKDDSDVKELKPLSTEQRQMVINSIIAAQQRKNKKWQDQLVPLVALSSMVLMIVCLMVFWGNLAEPLLEMADKQQDFVDTQKEIVEIMQDIKGNVQTIKGTDVSDMEAPNPNG